MNRIVVDSVLFCSASLTKLMLANRKHPIMVANLNVLNSRRNDEIGPRHSSKILCSNKTFGSGRFFNTVSRADVHFRFYCRSARNLKNCLLPLLSKHPASSNSSNNTLANTFIRKAPMFFDLRSGPLEDKWTALMLNTFNLW